jgi:PIN domain
MQAQIAIPAVVIAELLSNYRADTRDALRKLSSLSRDLLDVSAEMDAKYQEYVSFLDECQARYRILPYPRPSHQIIVERICEGKRPFHRGDGGYKDYLIWCSVAELMAREDESDAAIVFISANTGDFAAPKDDSAFHPDYLAGLSPENRKRLSYFTSIDLYNQSVIGDGFADLMREYPDAADMLRLRNLPSILNIFLAQNRPHRRWALYEAKDLRFVISHVKKLPAGPFSVSGIMDFMPCWHASEGGAQLRLDQWGSQPALVADNNWDAHVSLIVDSKLQVLKVDIDGEAVNLE